MFSAIKREALIKEIRKVEYEEIKDMKPQQQGFVKFSHLETCLKDTDLLNQRSEFTEWFICIFSCEETVFASDAVRANKGKIVFGKEVVFDNLLSDFEISISIYSLNVKNQLSRFSSTIQDSTFYLNQVCIFYWSKLNIYYQI